MSYDILLRILYFSVSPSSESLSSATQKLRVCITELNWRTKCFSVQTPTGRYPLAHTRSGVLLIPIHSKWAIQTRKVFAIQIFSKVRKNTFSVNSSLVRPRLLLKTSERFYSSSTCKPCTFLCFLWLYLKMAKSCSSGIPFGGSNFYLVSNRPMALVFSLVAFNNNGFWKTFLSILIFFLSISLNGSRPSLIWLGAPDSGPEWHSKKTILLWKSFCPTKKVCSRLPGLSDRSDNDPCLLIASSYSLLISYSWKCFNADE